MTQPLSLAPCKHSMPVGAVVSVTSQPGLPQCSLCEVEELRAENARLRETWFRAGYEQCKLDAATNVRVIADGYGVIGDVRGETAADWCAEQIQAMRVPPSTTIGSALPAPCDRFEIGEPGSATRSAVDAEFMGDIPEDLRRAGFRGPTPTPDPTRDHSGLGLRSAEEWLQPRMVSNHFFATEYIEVFRAIQANALEWQKAQSAAEREEYERRLAYCGGEISRLNGLIGNATKERAQYHNLTVDADDGTVIELHSGPKKLTLYLGKASIDFVKVWGSDCENEMADGKISTGLEAVELGKWLAK